MRFLHCGAIYPHKLVTSVPTKCQQIQILLVRINYISKWNQAETNMKKFLVLGFLVLTFLCACAAQAQPVDVPQITIYKPPT